MNDHFRVARRLKNRPAMLEPPPHFDGVRQVAIVHQRDFALVAIDHHRLRIHQRRIAGRRIARVPDCRRARQRRNHLRRKNLLHVSERLVHAHVRAIGRGNPGRFLPAMLQRVNSEIRQLRRFVIPEDAEHAAVIVEPILVELDLLTIHALSIAAARDSDQAFRKDVTSPFITGVPFNWMRNSLWVTVPIRFAATPYCAATALSRASEAAESETTARAPRSLKSAASAGPFDTSGLKFTSADSLSLAKHDSAIVTARPPSLTSCAE